MPHLPLKENVDALKEHPRFSQLLPQIQYIKEHCKPNRIVVLTGSKQEYDLLCDYLVAKGTFIRLNEKKRPGSFLARSDPSDVARKEKSTFICMEDPNEVGPTNHHADPKKMKAKLETLFAGCMKGRVAFVIPYILGPTDSPFAKAGIEVTDSAYVAVSMMVMTRVDLKAFLAHKEYVWGVHSVGHPLKESIQDVAWPCNKEKIVAHFPKEKEVWSFGSGYGGNALLAKKCFALRLASYMGWQQGWLAEHMLVVSVTNPKGKKMYMAGAFPSACGKTNLAMMRSQLPGWKIKTVGDDIAWLHIGEDGRLWAINPENGFFGVAPNTSYNTNPSMMDAISKNTVFTNVALTKEGDVWWEGMGEPPEECIDWKGQVWNKNSSQPAAHPNARFTVPLTQCPSLDESALDPKGVPISAILLGSRRETVTPLVVETLSWQQGVFLGAAMSSERTAAQEGQVGQVRHDPMAMLPFCGYNMAKYFTHLLSFRRKTDLSLLPKIYQVNWFRKKEGKFIWPGFHENMRVIKWIFERLENQATSKPHLFGIIPEKLDLDGLNLTPSQKEDLFETSLEDFQQEIDRLKEYFTIFKGDFPPELDLELKRLQNRPQEM